MPVANGATVYMAQDALIEELKQLFAGKTYCGQEGDKELTFFKQDLPLPSDNDDDADTDAAAAPFIVVKVTGSAVESLSKPQTAEVTLTICCYDPGRDRKGSLDVINIQEDIKQHFCSTPWFGGPFTVALPMVFALQTDDTHPYYFGNALFDITAPALTPERNKEIEGFV